MIIGVYYLTEQVDGVPGDRSRVRVARRGVRRVRGAVLGGDGETVSLHTKIKVRMPVGKFPVDHFARRRREDGTPQSIVLREYGSNGSSEVLVESSLGRFLLNTAFPDDFPFVDRVDAQARHHRGRRRARRALRQGRRRRQPRPLKTLGYEWSTRAGLTISISDVTTPPAKAGSARAVRGRGGQGREPVRPRHHHRRRAAPAGDRDLDRRDQPGDEGHAGSHAVDAVQPDRHDGRLGCPRKRHAGASDRRYARSRRQPAW